MQSEEEVKRLKTQLKNVEKDRDSWKSEWDMTTRAWIRELGGKVFPKTHLIDSLVLTTRQMKTNLEALQAWKEQAINLYPDLDKHE